MTLVNFRKYFLLFSQLSGITIGLYLIFNTQKYEVKWNLLTWLFPTGALELNKILSSIGTWILIIPLTIILLALAMPENIGLKIASSFLGITGSLVTIISGIFR